MPAPPHTPRTPSGLRGWVTQQQRQWPLSSRMELLPAGAGLTQSQDYPDLSSETEGHAPSAARIRGKTGWAPSSPCLEEGSFPSIGCCCVHAASGSVQAGPGEVGRQGSQEGSPAPCQQSLTSRRAPGWGADTAPGFFQGLKSTASWKGRLGPCHFTVLLLGHVLRL